MDSLPAAVRTVKTPRLPRPRPEEEDCAADRALAAAARDWQPVDPRTGAERYMIRLSLAHLLAYGRID